MLPDMKRRVRRTVCVFSTLMLAAVSLAHENLGFEPWTWFSKPYVIPAEARPSSRSSTARYSASCRVLGFHDIFVEPLLSPTSDVQPDNFRDMMRFLKRQGYNVVKVRDLTNFLQNGTPALPDNAVCITFDDNYRGQYWEAFPILQGLNFPATFYVHSGYVGVMTGKDHSTYAELLTMEGTGLHDVQSHTVNHVNLSSQTPSTLNSELVNSKTSIQTNMSKVVTEICYPYGGYNASVITAATNAGYLYGLTTNGGLNSAGRPLYEINRDLIGIGDTLLTFKNRMGYVGSDPGGPVIVDNADAGFTNVSGFAVTGNASSSTRGQYGPSYTQATAVTGAATATARWTASVPASASYDVYTWWPGASGALGENVGARYSILNGALSDTAIVNQSAAQKARWVKLGTWSLTTASNVQITLTNSVTSGSAVYADAIKIEPAGASVEDWSKF